jgi:hypothetical protein
MMKQARRAHDNAKARLMASEVEWTTQMLDLPKGALLDGMRYLVWTKACLSTRYDLARKTIHVMWGCLLWLWIISLLNLVLFAPAWWSMALGLFIGASIALVVSGVHVSPGQPV